MNLHRSLTRSVVALALAAAIGGCGGSAKPTGPGTALDTTPPPAPTGLKIVGDAPANRFILVWDDSPAPDLAGYEVFTVTPNPGGPDLYALIGETAASDPQLVLAPVGVPTDVTYQVRAFDTSANRSAYSARLAFRLRPNVSDPGGTGDPDSRPRRVDE